MLVAHVEQDGVFIAKGGMHGLACALTRVAESQGATFHFGRGITSIATHQGRVSGVFLDDERFEPADCVIYNGDASALAGGLLGTALPTPEPVKPAARSLSAMTWALKARTDGFTPAHHTVLFADDYEAEFRAIFRNRTLPEVPTTYVCAPDRNDEGVLADGSRLAGPQGERLFCLINAPADGDSHVYSSRETDQCLTQSLRQMERCGLMVTPTTDPVLAAAPSQFNSLFPGSGGALYGPASHGWMASFKRQGSRTAVPGLYLAGGSVHPGPGVPMAALSGRLAAESLVEDRATTPRFLPAGISGGMRMA
ncbi:MAG: FAD-dependent oxidoreductase [Sphingopyxis sp.]|nr:FAD-dependent oxidoreductase [Sphingopyxis sp.]